MPVEGVLAHNYVRLRTQRKAEGTWKGPGVNPKTANNVENSRHNTKLQTIINLAKALGVEPYHLLMPVEDEKFLAVMQAWAQSSDGERDNLHVIAEAMLKRKAAYASSDTPTIERKRNRPG